MMYLMFTRYMKNYFNVNFLLQKNIYVLIIQVFYVT